MSSYYTTAQLEAMRKAKLKADLLAGIERLSAQLKQEYKNDVECCRSSNIITSIFKEDEVAGGYDDDNEVDVNDIYVADVNDNCEHEELDFSELLAVVHKENILVTELNEWLEKAEQRVIFRKKDEEDRIRLLKTLSEIVQDISLDIEDKIKAVKMRVTAYIDSSYIPTETELCEISEDYFEYVALCQMLDITPREKYPYRVRLEIARMKTVLEKRAQDEYIMEMIQEIMTELGCDMREEVVLDHVNGRRFKVDGHEVCDVFVGSDGSGIMFEPIVEISRNNVSTATIETDIGHVCSLYKEVEDRAFERGIVLNRVYLESLTAQECCTEEKVSAQKKKKRKSISQKLKAIRQEG